MRNNKFVIETDCEIEVIFVRSLSTFELSLLRSNLNIKSEKKIFSIFIKIDSFNPMFPTNNQLILDFSGWQYAFT